MSLHFQQGEYDIWQNDKRVGRLVALDATSPVGKDAEYWYLYLDISTATFQTYTAPSQVTVPPSSGAFGQSQDVNWTFEYLGPPSGAFNAKTPSSYKSELESALGVPARNIFDIEADQVDCGDPIAPSQLPVRFQIFWGEYVLFDMADNQIATVKVPPPPLSTDESWRFSTGTGPHYDVYTRPATTVGTRTTYRFRSGVVPVPFPSAEFCVHCSRALG